MKMYAIVLGIGITAVICLTGCSSTRTTQVRDMVVATQQSSERVPGAVEYVWEEPMVDVIDNPPGLDPEGYYYIPGHQSVVEIRQGRWRHYREE